MCISYTHTQYICPYLHIYTYTIHIPIYIHTYTRIYVYIYICPYLYLYIYDIYTHTYMYTYIVLHIYTYMYVCILIIYTYIHIKRYIYIYIVFLYICFSPGGWAQPRRNSSDSTKSGVTPACPCKTHQSVHDMRCESSAVRSAGHVAKKGGKEQARCTPRTKLEDKVGYHAVVLHQSDQSGGATQGRLCQSQPAAPRAADESLW